MKKIGKQGFTLIELLAVIIILGILLLIAVPSVSKYITNSRLNTYKINILKLVDAVSAEVNSYKGQYAFSTNQYLILPFQCIEIEGGSNTNSPFGPYVPNSSFVAVTRKYEAGTNKIIGFNYYVAALDASGFGTNFVDPYSPAFKVISSPKRTVFEEQVPSTNPKSYKLTGEVSSEFSIETINKTGKLVTCDAFVNNSISNSDSNLLYNKILSDNDEVQTDTNNNANEQGLYYTSTNTEGNLPTYYFRGAVKNNYVQFGMYKNGTTVNGVTYNKDTPMYWKIIRLNEDGSIRIIYNGTSTTAIKQDVTIGESSFNKYADDNAYMGYMYGLTGQSGENAYKLTHDNDNPSNIKTYIDNWYESNLKTNYGSYLADAGFCNDRSVALTANVWNSNDTALGYGQKYTYYGAYNRLENEKQSQFNCPNADNDLFTLEGSTRGNAALKNPIGLITADEVWYAGATTSINKTHYLYTGANYWTMSPGKFTSSRVTGWYVSLLGGLSDGNIIINHGIRPVINIKGNVAITLEGTGDPGTSTNPYIIATN